MCGRYAMSFRPSQARRRLQDENMPVDEAPEDDDERIRQSYNFAPGYHGLVYRAETPPSSNGSAQEDAANDKPTHDEPSAGAATVDGAATKATKYKLQAMKWGLIPFWTKRAPDYGSQLKTINCRDDSLAQAGGMWNTMKQKKRCIIIAEGFYEWLKKNNGRDKIPHFVKRKDGQLMCFAGLWDCVKYEGQEEKLWTYTVITTSSNKQLNFLHDRMPVILDNGSDAMKTWLDPGRDTWSKELQSLLKPYTGELECFPVDKAVGKVGNNSPSFIVPVDSKENKKNIANFFSNQMSKAKSAGEEKIVKQEEDDVKREIKEEVDVKSEEGHVIKEEQVKVKQDPAEARDTVTNASTSEDNAPLPVPPTLSPSDDLVRGIKREFPDSQDLSDIANPRPNKAQKIEQGDLATTIKPDFPHSQDLADINSPPPEPTQRAEREEKPHLKSPERRPASGRKARSAVSNGSTGKTLSKPTGDGSMKITAFFGK